MQGNPSPKPAARAALHECATAAADLRRAYGRLVASVGSLHRSGASEQTGHRSLGRLIEEHIRVDAGEARQLVRHATLLTADIESPARSLTGTTEPAGPALPATAEATTAGEVGREHVTIVAEVMRRLDAVTPSLPASVLDEAERQLAGLARERTPQSLREAANEILRRHDPDGEPPHDGERPVEELRMATGRDGSLRGRFRFAEPEVAEAIRAAIEARTPPPDPDADTTLLRPGRELHERRGEAMRALVDDAGRSDDADTRDAAPADTAPADTAPADTDSPCPGPTDRGEGWRELRAVPDAGLRTESNLGPGATPARSGRGRDRPNRETTMIVTVPFELLARGLDGTGTPSASSEARPTHGLLDGRYAVTPETARRLACDAAVVPAVLGSRGEILDLGRRTRVVSAALRRAVVARDRHCAHPGCRRSPRRCDVHHVLPWACGGPTDLANLVLLCPYHHHQIHHSEWRIRMVGGRPVFIPPRWLDPDQRPRSNHSHRDAA